jgi:UDP-2,4-diacetamido-2,4,6-trideoxy-beta-L-altropyranose hydrolase
MINKIKSILIRTDGDNKIGMGHIYRSIAVGEELKKQGFEIHFLTPNKPMILNKLSKYGKCHITTNDLKNEISTIGKIHPSIIIIDLLKKFLPFRTNYFKSIKQICKILVTIDYVSADSQFVDIGIHSLFGPKKSKAKKIFFGHKFAVIRDNFKRSNFKVKKTVNSIIVLQGGSDTYCVSPKILKALNQIKKNFKITLIVGPAFKCKKELKQEMKSIKKDVTILSDVKQIHKIMQKHQMAISAAGNTSNELFFLGIPTVIIYGEKHEQESAEKAHKNKISINLGYGPNISIEKIISNVTFLLENYDLRNFLSKQSKIIVDGKGTKRIVKIITSELNQ